jgi:hypothetical protein
MTIRFSKDFTQRLVMRFEDYRRLEQALKLWDLNVTQVNTPKRELIERTGRLHDMMQYCKKNMNDCFFWDVVQKELANIVMLIHNVAGDMGHGDDGILSID